MRKIYISKRVSGMFMSRRDAREIKDIKRGASDDIRFCTLSLTRKAQSMFQYRQMVRQGRL